MAWSHPDISLEDLVKLIKGFVDILILASGYQSSGSPASWDSETIKKAVQWGVFFEQVFRRLRDSSDYGGSVKELDAVLSEMTSGSYFPQGLKDLSSTTLSRARELVLEHLFQSLSLGDTRLNNLIMAIIEVDIENNGDVDLYIEELIQHTKSLNQRPKKRSFMSKQGDDGNSSFIIQEILNRQATVSCLSSTEICMDALLEIIERNNSPGPRIDLVEGLNAKWNNQVDCFFGISGDSRVCHIYSIREL